MLWYLAHIVKSNGTQNNSVRNIARLLILHYMLHIVVKVRVMTEK
jgi:hypothetical protein